MTITSYVWLQRCCADSFRSYYCLHVAFGLAAELSLPFLGFNYHILLIFYFDVWLQWDRKYILFTQPITSTRTTSVCQSSIIGTSPSNLLDEDTELDFAPWAPLTRAVVSWSLCPLGTSHTSSCQLVTTK